MCKLTKLLNSYLCSLRTVVFLTDGQATAGELKATIIRSNVKQANNMGYSVFCLGFGANLDYDLLRDISMENNGFARRIYLGSDAIGTFITIQSFNYCNILSFVSPISLFTFERANDWIFC